jgi:hypothetical protein
MRIAKETQVLALVIGIQLASAAAALAIPPDYLLLKRCTSTMDERRPSGGHTWQISSSFVSIQLANGTGGHPGRHNFAFDTYAFCNGPNGYAEYGSGDDVCMGPASQLPGSLVYSAVTSAPDAASGNFSLTESPSGNYTNNLNVTATMNPMFNFVGATSITLSYYHHHAFLWTSAQDVGRVEVSTDGGVSWGVIARSHTYYLGDFGQFKRADVNLSAYAGNPTIRIRFRFTSDGGSVDNGWNIDDVRVVVDGSTAFFDDFENGTGLWTLQAPWGLSLANNTFSALGSINAAGLYTTTPVVNPVSIGEGMGFAAIRAQYTEGPAVRTVHTQIHHTAPQWKIFELGYDNLCPVIGSCAVNSVEEPAEAPSQRVILEQNSPNPFNPSTDIRFLLPDDAPVSLRIYDQAGRMVRVLLADQVFPAGEHFATWNGLDDHGQQARSGVYFYELNVGGREHTRKMVLVK